MIELTPEQARAMAEQKVPLKVLNPLTQEVYVLIRENVYELTCRLVQPFNRGVEDDPDMDVYEQYRPLLSDLIAFEVPKKKAAPAGDRETEAPRYAHGQEQ